MNLYKCIPCEFECTKVTNLKTHYNTSKHIKLVNIYYEKYNKLEKDNNKLEEDKYRLEKENNILKDDKSKLEEDKNKFEKENNKLKESKIKLEEDKNRLEKDKNKLEEDKNRLEKEKNKLEEDKNKLEEDKNNLNKKNIKLIQENIELKNKNMYLEKELKEKKDLNVLQSMKIGKLNKSIDNNKELKAKIIYLEKELKETKELLANERKELSNNHKELANEHKELINKIIDKEEKIKEKTKNNMSALTYANKHFTNAPPLSKINTYYINDYNCNNIEDKYKIIDLIFAYYDEKILHKLFGDHIIKFYKKENQEEQSFHTTDCSRLSYIVRQIMEDVNIWMNDKGGLIITEKVIEPLLKKCEEILLEFQKKLALELAQSLNFTNVDKRIYKILDIINIIKKGELAEEIHRYISSYFIFNRLLE